MRITDIKQQKRNNNFYSVYIDGEYSFSVEKIDIINYNLHVGKVLDVEKYHEIIHNVCFKKCLNKAYRLLTYKARTKDQMFKKLSKAGYDDHVIKKVINKLEDLGYIDDKEFVKSYIDSRLNNKPMGKIRIKYELLSKGIKEETIDSILNSHNLSEYENAIKLIKKKIKGNYDIMEKKDELKIKRFLQRRGFNYEVINKAVKRVKDEERCKN
ncbi:regulatory protein RecX [Thermohalobacter berrensis]|uniref:Regulatory protein RecX n=1 Tax=Thermohalobacter berrensis TaxID=99594 RepID=A0A419TAI6_9FIRM|nr:RecX family transcriptional regulator [Thermohalobacter berrensis]RKD34496.1 hypothetical protein BET03_01305 [Thermohalobacter berrensis]